jgi:molybdopterin molybdotransferase
MSSATQSTILTFENARHLIEQHAANLRPHGRELLDLLEANGRALAEPITADRDFPPFRRATRDGYAVRAADLAAVPTTLDVVAEAKAGGAVVPPIVSGQAVSIMTGAPVPDGADAIVMVEFTSRAGNRVEVQRTINPGDNVVPVGAEGKKGDVMLAPGVRLDSAAIALAAAVGRSRLVVYSRPRIAVLSTGDEVVDIDVPPGPNQIRNSNSYSLAIQITRAGGEPVLLPIAPDEPNRLLELLREGLESDLLLIAGGVSIGKYDLVEQALSDLNAEFFFTGAQIQPGKPVVFGAVPSAAGAHESSVSQKYFLGLPGNPISTMVCFELFARALVEAVAGTQPRKLSFVYAKLKTDIKTKLGLKRFLPANLSGEFENSQVELVHWQGSGDLGAVARSNCYIVIPPDRERIPAGEFVPVLLR